MPEKIVLVNPPNPPNMISSKDTMGGFGQTGLMGEIRVPVIDIAYVAAILEKEGLPTSIVDASALNFSIYKTIKMVKREQPVILGVRTSTPTVYWDSIFVSNLREELGKNVSIIIFGPHCSLFPEEILRMFQSNGVVIGEIEEVFSELARNYIRNGKLEALGLYPFNKSKPLVKNLDSLPFPAWHLTPIHRYNLGPLIDYKKPFLTSVTSRGCTFNCSYCPYVVAQGSRWRSRSPQNVVDELKYLEYKFNIKGLWFRDPTFTLDQKRTFEICDMITKERLNFVWRCETRPECLSHGLIRKMAEANCIGINIGVESGSPKILTSAGRSPSSIKSALEVSQWCKELGVSLFAFFVVGLPGENKSTIKDTIKLALKMDPDFIQFTIATPYPGTHLRQLAEEQGLLIYEMWDRVTGYNAVMRSEELSPKEIEELVKYALVRLSIRKNETLKLIRRLKGPSKALSIPYIGLNLLRVLKQRIKLYT